MMASYCFEFLGYVGRVTAGMAMLIAMVYSSHALLMRHASRVPLGLLVQSVFVVTVALTTAWFHLLSALHLFCLPIAISCCALTALLAGGNLASARAFIQFLRTCGHLLQRDAAALRSRWAQGAALLVLSVVSAMVLRAAWIPPVSPDAESTYAPRIALWIQHQGYATLQLPGGFRWWQTYFGGHLALLAGLYLPFHGDMFAPLLDAVVWLMLGLTVFQLSRVLGIQPGVSAAATLYAMAMPCVLCLVGSMYAELLLAYYAVVAILFTLSYQRHRHPLFLLMAMTVVGLAAATKITFLPIGAFVGGVLLLLALCPAEGKPRHGRYLLAGGFVAILFVLPWLILNEITTGYPFGYTPLRLGPWELGAATPMGKFLIQDVTGTWLSAKHELQALLLVFDSPLTPGPHASRITLGFAVVGMIPVFVSLLRRRGARALIIGGVLLANLCTYAQPSFTIVRMGFASSNARFLLPSCILATVLAAVACRHRWSRLAFTTVALTASGIHVWQNVGHGWLPGEKPLFIALGSVAAAMIMMTTCREMHSRWSRATRCGLLVVAVCLVAGLCMLKDRLRLAEASWAYVMGSFQDRYWMPSAARFQHRSQHDIIAVTSGPRPTGESHYFHYFLGRWLQNRVCYVPTAADGSFVDTYEAPGPGQAPSFDAWYAGLRRKQVTHVMAFKPPCMEADWMLARPELFERLEGTNRWGLFRIKAAASAEPWQDGTAPRQRPHLEWLGR